MLTSVHLINRLPSSVHNNKSPYECLYKTPHVYDDLRAFGCLAYASNTSASGDKFAVRGIPSVFLAYPPNTKGYGLLSLLDNTVFISRDVIFKEHIFPYNSSTRTNLQYMIPLPVHMPDTGKSYYYDDFDCLSTTNSANTEVQFSADTNC